MAVADVLSSILKHDSKVASYKIALLRAINDVVLNFPDLRNLERDVAVPLKTLAQFWVAYYWPFVSSDEPIIQGQRYGRGDQKSNDIAFRPQMTELRREWERAIGSPSRPSDGFFLINELRVSRRRQAYPESLHQAYNQALSKISQTLKQPIKYAGTGGLDVFAKPAKLSNCSQVVPIPGTGPSDTCLVIKADLWQTFQEMSLWVEALCIHEWCLFSEKIEQENQEIDRGVIYRLLTDRPDNRRPLTWERNNVDLLMMEGSEFVCPWTERRLVYGTQYDLDHLLPLAVYPINELWNLVPTDPDFNSNVKRDRLPNLERLQQAKTHLELAYRHYISSNSLSTALREDVAVRFLTVTPNGTFPLLLSNAVVDLIDIVAQSLNLIRF